MFSRLKRRINIKYFMAAYLGLLFIFSAWSLRQPTWLLKGLAIVVLYSAFDLLWTRVRDHVWYLPLSSWISGLVLSNVALLNAPPIFPVLLPLLAVVSKQVLHFGKIRHVFNPAAFAMLLLGFFTPIAAWWSASWGPVVLVIVSLVGLFILWRQERWHTTLPFLFTYGVLFFVHALGNGAVPTVAASTLLSSAGAIVFFATVMLIEPMTSGFPTRRQRMLYGCLVGGVAGLAAWAVSAFSSTIDPLLVGLLVGNLVAGLAFLPNRPKEERAPTVH